MPEGQSFNVLTVTERGRDAAQRAAVDAGHVPEQQTWTGLVKPAGPSAERCSMSTSVSGIVNLV